MSRSNILPFFEFCPLNLLHSNALKIDRKVESVDREHSPFQIYLASLKEQQQTLGANFSLFVSSPAVSGRCGSAASIASRF
jgi:hypothetical protein